MQNALKEIFQITNKYIVLATPLILFSLISSVYLTVSMTNNPIGLLLAITIFTLMSGAFISGWFYMVKNAVCNTQDDDPNMLLKEFPSGVGEYFLSALGLIFNSVTFIFIMLISSYFVGVKTIGNPNISGESLTNAIQSAEALKEFLTSLSAQQLNQLQHWNLLLLGVMALCYFLLILYVPAMFFKEKNPFKAIFVSLKDLFSRNFTNTLGVYILIFAINFVISIFAALTNGNFILNFVMTLVNFYCLILMAVGIFYYYYNTFVRSPLGRNIDTKI